MFTIFGRSVSCLVTPKLVGLVRDSTSFNNALISSSRENLLTPIVNRLIQVRTMASTSKENRSKVQNRLALEKSPYLLQHATNPVDWFPWGEEAFEKARREDKLIFLSVGYSTCHWCHVMERESFEDDAVAALLNRHFVSVKVDREERPDVDHLYMTFVQATSGSGGWPMSVWLTPDLLPVYGGTYYPPEDHASGRPGFATLLNIIQQQWRENRSKMAASGARVAAALRSAAEAAATARAAEAVEAEECARRCMQALAAAFDERLGGFGRAPKFPQAPILHFLLSEWARAPHSEEGKNALHMVVITLRCMARGGIRDHVGEGFARYSTDSEWHVPHFEKMLYDQGQLLSALAQSFLATGDELLAEAARGIVEYVLRDLSHPKGGFYSAEDADSVPYDTPEGKAALQEGAFYVWTEDEVRAALSGCAEEGAVEPLWALWSRLHDVRPGGNVPRSQDPHGELQGRCVPRRTPPGAAPEEAWDERTRARVGEARRRLLEARARRPRPRRDTKLIAAWNGLMISGLSRAGEALGDEALVRRAAAAASFARAHLVADGRLLRAVYGPQSPDDPLDHLTTSNTPIHGFLSDYALMVQGLLDLYEASLSSEWLLWAEELQAKQDELFWDPEGGGYFTSAAGDSSILFRSKEEQDGAEPCAGGVAAANLLRLAALTGREGLRARAEECVRAAAPLLRAAPRAAPSLCAAARLLRDGPLCVVVAGRPDDPSTQALLVEVRRRLLPGRCLTLADASEASGACALAPAPVPAPSSSPATGAEQGEGLLSCERREQLRRMAAQGPGCAFVCRRRTCSLPVRDPQALARLLDSAD